MCCSVESTAVLYFTVIKNHFKKNHLTGNQKSFLPALIMGNIFFPVSVTAASTWEVLQRRQSLFEGNKVSDVWYLKV